MRIDMYYSGGQDKFLGDGTRLERTPLVNLHYLRWNNVSLVLYKKGGSDEIILLGANNENSYYCMCESLI